MLHGNTVLPVSSFLSPGGAAHNCNSESILLIPGTIPDHQQPDKGKHDHI